MRPARRTGRILAPGDVESASHRAKSEKWGARNDSPPEEEICERSLLHLDIRILDQLAPAVLFLLNRSDQASLIFLAFTPSAVTKVGVEASSQETNSTATRP